tara:strand:- start:5116 stop:5322 length:207 start_codon:yes stop_codon:yes gene_type:complete
MRNKLYLNTGRNDKMSSTNFLNTPLADLGSLNNVSKVKTNDLNYQVRVNKYNKRLSQFNNLALANNGI